MDFKIKKYWVAQSMINSVVMIIAALFFLPSSSYGHEPDAEQSDKSIEFAAQGQFEEAKKELVKSLEANPFNKINEYSLKIIEDVMGDTIKRETALLLFSGTDSFNKGSFDEAISQFSKAINSEPEYSISYIKRGSAYTSIGQYDLALADADKAIMLNPDYTLPYINSGIAHAKKEEFDLAISDYNKAIEIDPKDADAYYNRGVANAKKGRAIQAILDFDRTIEINPKYAQAYLNRGYIYMNDLQNTPQSCTDWKQACELGLCSNHSLAVEKGVCK